MMRSESNASLTITVQSPTGFKLGSLVSNFTDRYSDEVEQFSSHTEDKLLWLLTIRMEQHLLLHKAVSLKHDQNKDVINASVKD